VTQCILEGVGVLRLRTFVFPWGRIYYVSDWSKFGVESPKRPVPGAGREAGRGSWQEAILEFLAAGISGFLASRAVGSGVYDLRLETSTARLVEFTLAGVFLILFFVTRTKRPSFANVVLFLAAFAVGFAR